MLHPYERGSDAKEFLETKGLLSRKPPIRSSDAAWLADPFGYYLQRRLGLKDLLEYSEALSVGTWTHTAFHLHGQFGDAYRDAFDAEISEAQHEYRVSCKALGKEPRKGVERILKDARQAQTIFDIALDVPIGLTSLRKFLYSDKAQGLGDELRVRLPAPVPRSPSVVAQFDRLMVHHGKLWILDLKTTALSPALRARSCSYDFQTQHYLHILRWMLESNDNLNGSIPGLDPTMEIGGMIHLIIQKPGLRFGAADDKEYRDNAEGKPEWTGGYSLEAYFERVCQRMGSLEQPVNISTTPADQVFAASDEYLATLDAIKTLASCNAKPSNFRRGYSPFGNPFADLYHLPVSAWPAEVADRGWVQRWRDDELLTDPTMSVESLL